ncbi:hypothetical protein M9458_056495, partial [Cirrhinus mrigala]
QTRTTLPVDKKLLVPSTKSHVKARKLLAHKHYQQKMYYDRTSKPLHPLLKGEVVSKVGTIKNICKEPRSYVVESE